MQETLVRFLSWEDLLEKGKGTHSSILAWRLPWTSPWGHQSRTQLSNFRLTFALSFYCPYYEETFILLCH